MFIYYFADYDRKPTTPTPKPKADDVKAPPAGDTAAVMSGEEEDDQASVGEEINHTLTLLLPWAISILMHLGIGLLAVFVVWSGAIEEEEDVQVPEARMLNDEPSELLTYSDSLEATATTDIPKEVETQTVAKGDPLSELTMDTASDLALIGVTGSKALPAGSRIGTDATGVGMYGVGGNAMTVVYVVDASGSMIDSLPFVINELKTSLRNLQPIQRFTIIFFQRGEFVEVPVPSRGMKRATPENIRLASDWITLDKGNLVPGGASNPTRALQLALQYRPDLVYILSDNITGHGQYSIDQNELMRFIDETKRQRGATNTKINTIQFLYPDPLETLRKIADAHGGRYRYVESSAIGR